MKNTNWTYLFVYITPIVVLLSLSSTTYWSFFAVFFVFVLVPFLELFTKASNQNLNEEQEIIAAKNKFYDWILLGLVPLQYFILMYFLEKVSTPNLTLLTQFGLTSAFGISCGVLGINAAHELGHRSSKTVQTLSKLLLATTLYMHFFIEHNRGHHKNVATNEDPASSRYGETVYAFYLRSIYKGWLSAWDLEKKRLQLKQQSFWSIHNEMLQFQLIQLTFILSIIFIYGIQTAVFFTIGAFIGILLLETVNYIEHYGLRRSRKGERYERTLPVHSWNSNHPLGRILLLELSRHSDHHYIASRKYPLLRHHEQSPQMPTGYPGMMLLSFIPPLWFLVMHKQLQHYTNQQIK
ncbi:alkane 1-monooxygenase [Flavobacterium sp. RSSB_23]|uniref:alkane 1-monooxygenase n=1 Tax=Flavobacterium sp. RSSB_23 TaxID=3447668 RepID=UPI003F300330